MTTEVTGERVMIDGLLSPSRKETEATYERETETGQWWEGEEEVERGEGER